MLFSPVGFVLIFEFLCSEAHGTLCADFSLCLRGERERTNSDEPDTPLNNWFESWLDGQGRLLRRSAVGGPVEHRLRLGRRGSAVGTRFFKPAQRCRQRQHALVGLGTKHHRTGRRHTAGGFQRFGQGRCCGERRNLRRLGDLLHP